MEKTFVKTNNDEKVKKSDIVEYDSKGNLVGYGTHADYDYYAVEVQNGNGYYDNEGHFHRKSYNPED